MEWESYDFILEETEKRADPAELTGWETVVFVVEDEEPGGQNMGFSAVCRKFHS